MQEVLTKGIETLTIENEKLIEKISQLEQGVVTTKEKTDEKFDEFLEKWDQGHYDDEEN